MRAEAHRRRLRVIDATCPLVTKVHLEVLKNGQDGYETILIGHRGHPEVDGTMGQYDTTSSDAIFLVESTRDAERIEVRNANRVAMVTLNDIIVGRYCRDHKDIDRSLSWHT